MLCNIISSLEPRLARREELNEVNVLPASHGMNSTLYYISKDFHLIACCRSLIGAKGIDGFAMFPLVSHVDH